MFYDPDGNEISLPAWVSGELADNELPLEDPEHARFRESVLSDDERRRRALAEHEEIVASLRARDADRLRRVLTAHTANVHEAALQRYGKED